MIGQWAWIVHFWTNFRQTPLRKSWHLLLHLKTDPWRSHTRIDRRRHMCPQGCLQWRWEAIPGSEEPLHCHGVTRYHLSWIDPNSSKIKDFQGFSRISENSWFWGNLAWGSKPAPVRSRGSLKSVWCPERLSRLVKVIYLCPKSSQTTPKPSRNHPATFGATQRVPCLRSKK